MRRLSWVSHGCYDAPCQLKLGSFEGIALGASKHKVYDGDGLLEIGRPACSRMPTNLRSGENSTFSRY
jgi:hypothetical protein